jgi:predicted nucleotidyltransferase
MLSVAEVQVQRRVEEARLTLKKYFYHLRPLLAAEFVLTEKRMPPVVFTEMLDQLHHTEVRNIVEELIIYKREVKEDYRMAIPKTVEDYFAALNALLKGQLSSTPRRTVDRSEADLSFRELIGYP